jgi:uncharacterized protein
MAVYYASKAYVLSFSEALHQELSPRGVSVTALCPGPVPTEFQSRAGLSGERMGGLLTLSAERVAQIGYDGLRRRKRVVVAGAGNQIGVVLLQFMPRAWLLPLLDWGMRQAASRP